MISRESETNFENNTQINSIMNSKKTSKVKDEFTFELKLENETEDEYEKILEKEIESNCNFGEYIDKLELEEKPDSQLISLSKEEIIEFKNNQIQKLKAYIASLEMEKDDLIENFRQTTNILLEKIKEMENNNSGFRPDTPMIAKNINKKKSEPILSNEAFFDKPYNPKKEKQRCPNCTSEFLEEDFIAHSLNCLRNKIRCKKCGEMIEEKHRKEHINEWRSSEVRM